ncbi:MAG TPA: flagellar basal body P-ring formation chaperone FlgA [Alphaproteobacteria bacterium]
MRIILVLLLAVLGALPARAAGTGIDSAPPRLVHSVTITGDILRLGDIFQNVGDKADKAIAYAPAPGRRATLDAYWLAETARRNGLDWEPRSPSVRVTVERASQTIGADAIEAELRAALSNYGGVGELRIELDDRVQELHIPADAPPTLAIRNLRINEQTGRFGAAVLAPADRPTVEMAVTGRAVRVTEVPVPAHHLSRGDVIQPSDLTLAKVPVNEIGRDTLTDPKAIVGLEATRHLGAGEPIRARDVRPEVLVRKNSLVTIVLRSGGMELTVQGKALDEGARDGVVKVMNTKSKRVLEARVDGPGTVVVAPPGALALN